MPTPRPEDLRPNKEQATIINRFAAWLEESQHSNIPLGTQSFPQQYILSDQQLSYISSVAARDNAHDSQPNFSKHFEKRKREYLHQQQTKKPGHPIALT